MKNGNALCITCTLMIFSILPSSAQDTLRLKNHDELRGEIKSLNKSVLTIKTNYSHEDFSIDWDEVVDVISPRRFTIFLSSNDKAYATFIAAGKPGYATIEYDGSHEVREVPLDKIVFIEPIQDSFAKRFNASISAGFSITKENNSRQLSIRGTMSYHPKQWVVSGNLNTVRNSQDLTSEVKRTDGSINFNYLLYNNWFAGLHGDFLSNTEQQLLLRSTQTISVGNLIIRNNKLYLSGSAGFTFNREDYSNEIDILNSKEGFVGAEFNAYDIGALSFLTKLGYYHSFSDAGRYRVNASADVKYKFLKDFFIKLGYTLNFDSKPPNEGAREDYVSQTTLGWEF